MANDDTSTHDFDNRPDLLIICDGRDVRWQSWPATHRPSIENILESIVGSAEGFVMSQRRAGDARRLASDAFGSLPPPQLITTPAQLDRILPRLLASPVVAVDTEANSLFAYYHKVCLIQLSTPDTDYVIDPLAIELDIRPLSQLLATPAVQKVLHAAENDILVLKRDYGFTFSNVFDTLWAARILGWPEVGLGAILTKHFGIPLNKQMQRANWGKRPLTREQLAYARLDTHFLIPLRDMLVTELEAKGRLAEALEAFAGLPDVEYVAKPFDPEGFWRMRGVRDLPPKSQAVLQALYLWREDKARSLDRPPFKVLADHALLTMAQKLPTSMAELTHLSGMNRSLVQRAGSDILETIRAASAGPPPAAPKRNNNHHATRPDEETLARYELLRSWRTDKAIARGVDPDVVLTNETLMHIARQMPATLADLETCPGFGPNKRHLYGREIIAILGRDRVATT